VRGDDGLLCRFEGALAVDASEAGGDASA
jgi:hypothetical protein